MRAWGRSARLAAWLGGSLVALAACMPLATRRQWEPAQGFAVLLAQARDEADQLTDLVAEVRVTADNGVQRQQASAVLQLKAPGMLRLEVRGPLYSHLLTVVQVGDTLYVEGPAVDGAWHGPVRGPLLARLTGLELGGYDLRDALLGVVQPAPVEAVEPLADGDLAVVRLGSGAGGRHRVWIDAGRGLVRREELAVPDSGRALTRRLGDYRRVGPALLPGRVEFRQGGSSLRLEYVHCWTDRRLRRELFLEATRRPDSRLIE